jgi:hypothetical protein
MFLMAKKNASEVGCYLKERLQQLQERYSVIGDVRGLGLYLGIEFVLDRESKQPARELATFVKEELKRNFILTGRDFIVQQIEQ